MIKIDNAYTELTYEIARIIYYERLRSEDLYLRVRKNLKINKSDLIDFLNMQFKKDKNGYCVLNDNDKSILNIMLNKETEKDNFELNNLDNFIRNNNLRENFQNDSSYFIFLKKSFFYLAEIDELKNYPITNNYEIKDICDDFLEDLNIQDLLKLPNIEIYYKTRLFLDYFIFVVKNMDFDFDNYFGIKYNSLIEGLNDIQLQILYQRIISNNPATLEELGKIYHLTRERIRQIESKILRNLRLSQTNKHVLDYFMLSFKSQEYANSYALEKVTENLSEKSKKYFMILINESMNTSFYFDRNLNLIVEKGKFSYELLRSKIIRMYGEIIHKDVDAPIQLKYALKEFYNEYNNIYLLKGLPKREMILKIVDEHFNRGYKISSEKDYEKFVKMYRETYGNNEDIPELRSVQLALSNSDFITVEKGLYKNIDLIELINESLLNEIAQFISIQKENVYYKTIFHEFKEKLEAQGINNWNYLKGLMDYQLSLAYHSKRDYIKLEKNYASPNAKLKSVILEFEDKFNLDDLRRKYPGIADHVFMNLIAENKEIIKLDKGDYILFNNLKLNSKLKKELENFIAETFDALNLDIITSRKVFSRLNLKRPDLVKSLNKISHHSSLFSLINYYFHDKYQLRRPLISRNSFENLNTINVIRTHFEEFDEITIDQFIDYSNRIGLRENFGFNELASLLSDKFIQVNESQLSNIVKLNIKREDIVLIKAIILREIRNGSRIFNINSRILSSLPKMNFSWSLYSFLSFIRTYLSDSIENEYKAGSTGLYEISIKEII
jgi:hypothetical protein